MYPVPTSLTNYNWKDITEQFKTNCNQLELGELVKEEA